MSDIVPVFCFSGQCSSPSEPCGPTQILPMPGKALATSESLEINVEAYSPVGRSGHSGDISALEKILQVRARDLPLLVQVQGVCDRGKINTQGTVVTTVARGATPSCNVPVHSVSDQSFSKTAVSEIRRSWPAAQVATRSSKVLRPATTSAPIRTPGICRK